MQRIERYFDLALEAPDGIKRLRELILTLAMQGKLVEQDPNDPPAAELLQEIEKEKQRLLKQGKIKPPKPPPPIKPEEIPYQLPKGWQWTRLGDCMLKITDGTHHSPPNTNKGDFLYISAKNIKDDGILLDNATYVTKEIHKEIFSRCDPEFGNILYIKDGATTGIAAINTLTLQFSMLSSVALLKQPTKINNRYLYFALKSPYFYQEIRSGMTGVAITRVTLIKLNDSIIPLAPFAEQLRIVAKIDQLMARCDELERLRTEHERKRISVHTAAIHRLLSAAENESFQASWAFLRQNFDRLYTVKENVAELRKAILQLAVMGKLIPQDPHDPPASELLKEIEQEKQRLLKQGKIKPPKPLPPIKPEEIPYELPKSWQWVRLGELGETQTGTTPPKNDKENFGAYIPFIGPGNIKNHSIDYSGEGLSQKGLLKGRLIEKSSVLMVCIGGSIGKHAMNDRDITCNQQINTITPYHKSSIKYLFIAMGAKIFQKILIDNASGSATPIINKQKWSNVPIPLPPKTEQRRIVAEVDRLMALCDELERQIDAATAQRTALLNALLQ